MSVSARVTDSAREPTGVKDPPAAAAHTEEEEAIPGKGDSRSLSRCHLLGCSVCAGSRLRPIYLSARTNARLLQARTLSREEENWLS